MFFNWIKSYFVKSNEINQDSYNHISTPIEPPYSLLTHSSLSIKDIQKIQEIIEEYGHNFKENDDKEKIIQDTYTQLFSISSEDENIRYHRFDVFNWLINDLNIKMDEECIKASFQYEFVPAIEMYDSKININLELSKSGNYVIFSKFVRLDSVNLSNQNNNKKEYKYAQLMPIFLYNSVDCVRFILSKNLDLNECSWFDSSGARFEMFTRQYRNPFHIAIKHQYFDLIYMILNYTTIDVNKLEYLASSGGLATLGFSAEKKLTPLEISIYTDNSDMVNLILSLDQIDVNEICYSCYIYGHSKNTNNLSIFYAAALHENLEILEIILKSKRIDTKVKSLCKKIDTGYTVYRNVELDVDVLKNIKNKNVFDILSKYGIK